MGHATLWRRECQCYSVTVYFENCSGQPHSHSVADLEKPGQGCKHRKPCSRAALAVLLYKGVNNRKAEQKTRTLLQRPKLSRVSAVSRLSDRMALSVMAPQYATLRLSSFCANAGIRI